MKIMVLALLLISASSAAFAQTTAEDFYKAGDLKYWKVATKEAPPEAADAAIVDYDSAIRLKADYPEAYNGRANVKFQKGDLDGALSDYSKAIEFSSATAVYYANRASLREKMKDIKGALSDSGRELALSKVKYRAYLNRGRIRLGSKDYAGAIADFNKSLELKPGFLGAHASRAEAYRALGKNDLAAADEKMVEEGDRKWEEKLSK